MDTMNPREIKTHPAFESLFTINAELLARIEADMTAREKEKKEPYDYSQPVILAELKGLKEPVCIDGHTRIQAAINAGIESVPVFIHEDVESEEEAKLIAIKLQCNRRNLNDGELMTFLEVLDNPTEQVRDSQTGRFTAAQHCATGKSADAIAQNLNISTRKAEQLLTVKRHGDPELKQAVKEGRISGHRAYKETQKRRKTAKDPEKTLEPTSLNAVITTSDVSATAPNCGDGDTAKVADTFAGEKDRTTVALKPDQYRALRDLGETIEYHVEMAIDMYLQMMSGAEIETDDDACLTTE